MITIFRNRALTSAYVASEPAFIVASKLDLAFTAEVTTAATIQWYLEFGDQPFGPDERWFREMSEEVATGGAVTNAIAVRSFAANGGGTLAVGTHRMSLQFERIAPFYRISARVSAGAAALQIETTNGQVARSPS